ncbi:DUF6069 family protein [Rhodococcus sp. NPDC060086]|uniref:DUF6069 family protein n=1 Tax=Rhodococcus sp. NPDC060086 TaxID=3347055 RepID=UPI00365764A3
MSVTRTSSVSSTSVWSREYGRPTIVVASVLSALIANLVLWSAGLLAGGSFEYTDAGAVVSVAPGGVVLMTVVPLTVGLTVAALLSLWWNPIVRIAQVVGALLPLATIQGTLSADFDGPSTVTLVLMHVVVAVVVVLGLEKMRDRT